MELKPDKLVDAPPPNATAFAAAPGYAAERKRVTEMQAVMRAMAEEQREEWEDYLRRCNGCPISSVRP
jgi:hypothetical protein